MLRARLRGYQHQQAGGQLKYRRGPDRTVINPKPEKGPGRRPSKGEQLR
jgi:hypothetical protein